MLQALKSALNLSLTVVTDAMYIKALLIQWAIANQVTLIGCIRKDAVLYEPAPESKRKGRGRPRKYGHRIKDLHQSSAWRSYCNSLKWLETANRKQTTICPLIHNRLDSIS